MVILSKRLSVSLWYFRYTMQKDKLLLADSEQHTGIGWHWCKVCGEMCRWMKNFLEANIGVAP